jgi:hypothetical protein
VQGEHLHLRAWDRIVVHTDLRSVPLVASTDKGDGPPVRVSGGIAVVARDVHIVDRVERIKRFLDLSG